MTFLIYLWTRVDTLISTATSLCTIIGIAFISALVVLPLLEGTDCPWSPKPFIKKGFIALSICFTVILVTPSQKDIVLIYTIPKILESKTTTELMDTVKLLPKAFRKYVEEYLADNDTPTPKKSPEDANAL